MKSNLSLSRQLSLQNHLKQYKDERNSYLSTDWSIVDERWLDGQRKELRKKIYRFYSVVANHFISTDEASLLRNVHSHEKEIVKPKAVSSPVHTHRLKGNDIKFIIIKAILVTKSIDQSVDR